MNSKRALEADRESSGSPTKIRQVSNSPKTPTKFKQPMVFKPASKPSPSREDQWKKELGISDNEDNIDAFLTDDEDEDQENNSKSSQLEINVLQRELSKKERQRDELLGNLKTLARKVEIYREKLEEIEEVHRSQMKIMKSTFETKFSEKDKTILNLQSFVDQAEMKIKNLLDDKGGEDAEVLFNFSNSVQPLIQQIKDLQAEKISLTEKNLQNEYHLSKERNELQELRCSIKTNYVPKDEQEFLIKEKQLLQNVLESRKVLEDKANKYLTPRKSFDHGRIEMLESEIQQLQDKLRTKDDLHFAELTEVESENIKLKKKLRDLESKYTILSCTPPKMHIRKVVDDRTEKELECVKQEKQKLFLESRKFKRQIDEMIENKNRYEEKIKRFEEEGNHYKQHIKDLETERDGLKSLQIRIEQEMIRKQNLQDELNSKDSELELVIKEFHHREATLKTQTVNQIRDAVQATERKYADMRHMYDRLKLAVSVLAKELQNVKRSKDQLQQDVVTLQESLKPSLNHVKTQLLHAVDDTNRKSQILVHKYKKEMQLRKKLHNTLVELRGNIRVLCRVRPIIREDGPDCINVTSFDEDDSSVLFVNHKNSVKQFDMDRVFKPDATQREVFLHIQSLITSCLDGYNVCIFAYGQTGSGKTYTMEGTRNNPGVNQQALMELFKEAAEQVDWQYTILVSYMEIYNEMLRDLLSKEPTAKLDIKQSKDGVHVPDLTYVKVTCVDEVNEVIGLGHRNRMTACTDMNERSSRSHSILTVSVIGRNINTKTKMTGKLNLVDLAGSERISKSGSEGVRLKEAQNINKSLSALGDVIHSLKNKQQHVPYRNTKLTYLLQDSLGGDSKTLMVVQVSPVEKNVSETVCSLNFAQRVRSVELGKASRKVEK